MIITELQAETTYSVTVGAYTTKGDGARSKPKLITTTGAGIGTATVVQCYTVSSFYSKAGKTATNKGKKGLAIYSCHRACKV